ncbi:ATP-dependent helicase [Heyndrickxia vini]|uniref:DNA 3'-5' helicase n=1 Tax=Heyndrickxia vini TaxID=1476025 RepID=A0ABX7E3H4_9BACI|nr:ATP-dependent helicase [Heyndrickxia vini]QQZ08902.1 ATP-dependent helicase [Heyndrickxia vini]
MSSGEKFFESKQQQLGVSLNDVQKKAVLQTEGPLLLLATPGSGKTTTIIMRIGYIIEEKGVHPARIKAVTFSKASAIDMEERFKRFFPSLPPVHFSTIHSLAFAIVREHFTHQKIAYQLIEGGTTANQNNRTLNKKMILRELFKEMVGELITEDQLDELTTYISYIKNKLLPQQKWSTVECTVPQAEQILREYEKVKRTSSNQLLVDYDDMLTIANGVLDEEKELLQKYQQRYDYFLTDESQDTSMVQHAIIEKLVQQHKNLCVVADDDQSIYTWRAAEPQYLMDFKKIYPEATILKMEQNYRSSKNIVDVANQFIKRNKNRYDKNMFTDNPVAKPIIMRRHFNDKNQTSYLVKEISGLANYQDVAVLYRNNSSSIPLINLFDRAGIPFYIKDSDNRFFSHWVVEDMLNFMRMTFNDKRVDILDKIHMKFNGYITKQQMAELKAIRNKDSVFDNLLKFVQLKDYQVKQLKKCKEIFHDMQGNAPLSAIRSIRYELGYEKAIEKMSERLGFNLEYLVGILNTLEEIADTLESMEEFAHRLKYLEELMKNSKRQKSENVVTLSTFHSSKGLEFKRVYMIDLVDGIIPSKPETKSYDEGKPELMEEAVRLFYVGMTRAKHHLELLSYEKKNGSPIKESPFLNNIRQIIAPAKEKQQMKASTKQSKFLSNPNGIKARSQLSVGKMIKHRVFGHGEITLIGPESIDIRFQSSLKKLSLSTCLEMGLLEPVD